jgi:hypothetical protein
MFCGKWYESRVVRIQCKFDEAEDEGMSFIYRLKRTVETNPPWATPTCILRRVVVAGWKDVWNVLQSRYEDMVFTR